MSSAKDPLATKRSFEIGSQPWLPSDAPRGCSFLSLGDEQEAPLALTAAKDGAIFLGGKTNPTVNPFGTDAALVRLGPDGAMDTTFGGGVGIVRIQGQFQDQIDRLALDDAGRIVASGLANTFSALDVGSVMRFSPDGQLDTTFGVSGFSKAAPLAVGVVPGPAGEILVAGTKIEAQLEKSDCVVARLTSSGAADASFGVDGVATYNSKASKETANQMLIQPDGKIVGAGTVLHVSQHQAWITRLLPDGGLDSSFGDGGREGERAAGVWRDRSHGALARREDPRRGIQ